MIFSNMPFASFQKPPFFILNNQFLSYTSTNGDLWRPKYWTASIIYFWKQIKITFYLSKFWMFETFVGILSFGTYT